MKKILLTLVIVTSLFACQTGNLKSQKQVTKNANMPVLADDVLLTLDECYMSELCKKAFDLEINDWLVDKNYITDAQVTTDEADVSVLEKNRTNISQLPLVKVNLSSNYMNNALVKGALNEWLTWKRPQLINTWQYYQFLREGMIDSFEQYNIDESFILAIMAQESGGKVHARSRAGAGGLFQLMPATAKRMGLSGKKGAYDLRFNPQDSALAAAKYIDEQFNKYDGDKAKILAAYNSGENRFARLNKKYKNKPLWDKSFFYELPRETRHYIPVVIAAMLIFQDPEKFNVSLDPVATDIITVQLPMDSSLSELSFCLGQEQRSEGWFRVLRNLNSGVKADKPIKANTDLSIPGLLAETFALNCQNKALMKLAQSFHEADFKGNQGLFNYHVRQGDSLYKIVKKFSCTTKSELVKLNQLKAPRYLIRAGKYLKVPQC